MIEEELELLDGTLRRQVPYVADLALYRTGEEARSRFRLRPSEAARSLPIRLGAEDVAVFTYGGETVRGNVLGPDGGAVTSAEGDVVEIPAGALSEPTPVTLERRPDGQLPFGVPAGTDLIGLLELELGGRTTAAVLGVRWTSSTPPPADETVVLVQLVDLGSGVLYRPVAGLAATATGWTTADADLMSWHGPEYAKVASISSCAWPRPSVS